MSYRQPSIQIVLCNFEIWIKLHKPLIKNKPLIVEFSPFLHEVSILTYCQEEHRGILGCLWKKCFDLIICVY